MGNTYNFYYEDKFKKAKNEQYIEWHKNKDYKLILEHSYSLIATTLIKYRLYPHYQVYRDCFHACISALANKVADWDYTRSAWSTYVYWYLIKAVQEELAKTAPLSYGDYYNYRNHSVPCLSIDSDSRIGKKTNTGSDRTLKEGIEDKNISPPDIFLGEQEYSSGVQRQIKQIKKYLDPLDYKATWILFVSKSRLKNAWVRKNYLDRFDQYNLSSGGRKKINRDKYVKDSKYRSMTNKLIMRHLTSKIKHILREDILREENESTRYRVCA